MDFLQQQIDDSIAILEEREANLKKILKAAQKASDTSFELRFDGIAPYTRFRQNMIAFQEYMPNVHDAFIDYEPTKFDAVVMDNGDLNILDLETEEFLYGQNPKQLLASQYLSFRESPNVTVYDINPGDSSYNFVHVKHLGLLRDEMNSVYEGCDPKEHFPEAIKSMMTFGIGIGYQIEWLVRDCQIRNLYIFEPEIDLLYVSLFSIDWGYILRKIDDEGGAIHLSIALEPGDHFSDLQKRMNARGQYDASFTYCMVHYRSSGMQEVIDEVMAQYARLVFGFGFFDDALMSISHQAENMRKKIPYFGPMTDETDQTPVFLVANGPSLDKTIETVRANKEKAIIVSLGSAINALHKYGITPHVHMEMERTRPTVNVLNAVNDPEYLKQIPLIALNTVHPEVFDFFDEKYIYCKTNEAGTSLLKLSEGVPNLDEVRFCNPTVSNLGMSVMASLGYKNIYLFGVDLGFPDNRHHSEKSIYFEEDGDDKKLFEINPNNLKAVPGNYGGEVMTDTVFGQSARVLSLEIEEHEGLNVYNLSDGVQIRLTEPLEVENLTLVQPETDVEQSLRQKFNNTVVLSQELEDRIRAKIEDGKFDEMLDKLVEINRTPVTSRYELMLRVDKQFELIYLLENSVDVWLADMIRGSLLYIHSLTQKGIMLPADEQEAIEKYNLICEGIVDYLEACRTKFHQQVDVPDQTDLGHLWK